MAQCGSEPSSGTALRLRRVCHRSASAPSQTDSGPPAPPREGLILEDTTPHLCFPTEGPTALPCAKSWKPLHCLACKMPWTSMADTDVHRGLQALPQCGGLHLPPQEHEPQTPRRYRTRRKDVPPAPGDNARRCCTAARAGGLQQMGTDGTITHPDVGTAAEPLPRGRAAAPLLEGAAATSPPICSPDTTPRADFYPRASELDKNCSRPGSGSPPRARRAPAQGGNTPYRPPFHPQTPERCLPAATSALSSLALRHG